MQVTSIQNRNSFAQDATNSAVERATRDAVGAGLDSLVKSAPVKVAQVAAVGYGEMLGLGREVLPGNPFQYMATPEGREMYRGMVQLNTMGQKQLPKSMKEFAAKTLYGANAAAITAPLAEGKVFTAASKVAGLGLGVAPVISKTAQAYKSTDSVVSAAGTFAKEGAKELVSWEAGTIAWKVAQAITPLKGVQVLASLAAMAATSTAVKRILG